MTIFHRVTGDIYTQILQNVSNVLIRTQFKIKTLLNIETVEIKQGITHHGLSCGRLNCMARPHFTKSSFHLQLAGWVLVRHPCGDPGPTALGAGAPLGALLCTLGGRLDQSV